MKERRAMLAITSALWQRLRCLAIVQDRRIGVLTEEALLLYLEDREPTYQQRLANLHKAMKETPDATQS